MQPISVDAAPLARLRARLARLGAPLCLGIDPHPDALPSGLPADVGGIETFARGIVEAASEHAVAGDGELLCERVARWVAARWPGGRVGLVVGATRPEDLRRLRDIAPSPAFLVPGVGAQGGELAAAVACCHGTDAPGVVNVS